MKRAAAGTELVGARNLTNALGRAQWALTIALLWAGAAFNPDGMVVLIALVASLRGLAVIFARGPRPAFHLPARESWSAAGAYAALALILIISMKASHPAREPAQVDPAVASVTTR